MFNTRYLLGGGYSLKSNQCGLGADNIVAFQIVLPNGKVENVRKNDKEYEDLFRAVKACFSF